MAVNSNKCGQIKSVKNVDKNNKYASEVIQRGIAITLVVILSGIFISFIWNNNVWMDEAFTASLVHTGYIGVLYRSMMDTLPPLYNLYLKTMTLIFGYSIPVMKFSSVIPMIMTLILGMTVVRRRFGLKTAILFDMLITFMPLMIYFGVEIRMYSMGFFFATASGVYAYELVNDFSKKNLRLFVLFSVLAGYSHHFAFVSVGFVFLYLLLYYNFFEKQNIKRWFKCLLYTFVFYLPCLIVTLRQLANVSGYFSMPDVDLHLFIQYVLYPFMAGKLTGSVCCALLCFGAIVIVLFGICKNRSIKKEDVYALLCFSIYYGVLIFGTIISKIMTANIFVDRYLFFSTGLLWLFAAIIYGKSDRRIYTAAVIAALIVGVCVYMVEYKTEYSNSADEEIKLLRENVKDGDVFLGLGGHEELENCIPFYSMVDEDTPELRTVYSLKEGIEFLKVYSYNQMIIGVFEDYEFTDLDLQLIEQAGLELEKLGDCDFDRYTCELYIVR